MGPKPNALDEKITTFVLIVRKNFKDARIILFGSRARGDFLKDSDYDFIIVSEQFQGIDFIQRMTDVLRKCHVRFAAEILCYTPAEFEKKKNQIGIVREAVREGIVL